MSDNRADNVINEETRAQLGNIVDRIVNLHEQRAALADDVADVLKEAESNGFDKTAVRSVVKIKMEPNGKREKRQQSDDALSTYLAALGLS